MSIETVKNVVSKRFKKICLGSVEDLNLLKKELTNVLNLKKEPKVSICGSCNSKILIISFNLNNHLFQIVLNCEEKEFLVYKLEGVFHVENFK